jgi:1-acyl-sn-glycerol-3-phosphate acyltransferase
MTSKSVTFTFFDYLRSILSILSFFLLLIICTPLILILLLLSFGKLTNVVVEKIACPIAKISLRIAGIQFIIQSKTDPLPDQAVYIINHASTLDILTILALGLPRIRFVAKWQFQYNPLFLLLGRLTGQVFIRREKSEKAVNTLKKNVARIKRQKLSLLMSPEGSRKHDGIIGPFKKGPFHMALELDYPIIPIFFDGNSELSPGAFMVTKPGIITAYIHPPIKLINPEERSLDRQISDVRDLYLKWVQSSKESPINKETSET